MKTHEQIESTRTMWRTGVKRRLSLTIVAIAAFASLAIPSVGSAAGNGSLASDPALKLPPHVCYNDAIGTYYCYFVRNPFPDW
jgi:hypothetical protein